MSQHHPNQLIDLAESQWGISPESLAPHRNLLEPQLFQVLKNKFQVNEAKLLSTLAQRDGHNFMTLESLVIDPHYFKRQDPQSLRSNRIIPICEDGLGSCVATDDPYNPNIANGCSKVYLSSRDFQTFWEKLSRPDATKQHNILDKLLIESFEKKASDIHLYTEKDIIKIKLRIGGELYPLDTLSKSEKQSLVNLIKLHAHMDISITTLPQDGHLTFTYQQKDLDIRVSSLPTIYGEDFVLRLFQSDEDIFNLTRLGFTNPMRDALRQILNQDHGLFLVTGPTGSGKTTSLYACIHHLLTIKRKNIVTLEDPIEYVIPGVRQSQINSRIDYSFVKGLRSVLRQDPDIIVIGEIRDQETAKIALDAAYTGHLVLSSLHTSDVSSTLMRLSSFDLDPFLLTHSLKGILSQKLVPQLCSRCKYPLPHDAVFKQSYKADGCDTCQFTSVEGRTVVAECLNITNPIQFETLQTDAKKWHDTQQFLSFSADVTQKVEAGLISPSDGQQIVQDIH